MLSFRWPPPLRWGPAKVLLCPGRSRLSRLAGASFSEHRKRPRRSSGARRDHYCRIVSCRLIRYSITACMPSGQALARLTMRSRRPLNFLFLGALLGDTGFGRASPQLQSLSAGLLLSPSQTNGRMSRLTWAGTSFVCSCFFSCASRAAISCNAISCHSVA